MMDWTPIVVAIIVGIPPSVLAYSTLVQGRENRKSVEAKVDVVVAKTDAVAAKSDTIIEKAAEIHTLTNSRLSEVTAALGEANVKIEGLEKLVGVLTVKPKNKKRRTSK